MNEVVINKNQLIECVKTNREQHLAEYNEARANYRVEATRLLKEELEKLGSDANHEVQFRERAPHCHVKDYDRALGMLAMSAEDNIKLDARQYDALVRNDWEWREDWRFSNAKYLSR